MDPLILAIVVLSLAMTVAALAGMAIAYWHIYRKGR